MPSMVSLLLRLIYMHCARIMGNNGIILSVNAITMASQISGSELLILEAILNYFCPQYTDFLFSMLNKRKVVINFPPQCLQ